MPAQDNTADAPRQLVLVKKDQRWVFRYRVGQEAAVLRTLATAAKDPDVTFDWFDAAVLSHQMGHRIGAQLEKLRKG